MTNQPRESVLGTCDDGKHEFNPVFCKNWRPCESGVADPERPGLRCNHCGTTYEGLTGPCPKCGKSTGQKLVRLSGVADRPGAQDSHDIYEQWRSGYGEHYVRPKDAWDGALDAVATKIRERAEAYRNTGSNIVAYECEQCLVIILALKGNP